MPEFSKEIKLASDMILDALRTINEAHLANFSRKRVPEIELVKHVRKELRARNDVRVFKTVKGPHKIYDKIVFLRQPDVDLSFEHQGLFHGIEFKLMRKNVSFYSGLDEAIAYSTYGVDYSWIVHFFKRKFENAKSYEEWMKFVIRRSNCPSVGYIVSTAQNPKVMIYPRKPFRRMDRQGLEEVVLDIRKHYLSKPN